MTWTRETLRAEILRLLEAHMAGDVKVTESSHLVADLSIDSLGVMEIVADIEDKFKLSLPDDMLRQVDTVADVMNAIELKLKNEGRLSE